jgi:hypothetical protein
MLRIPKIRPFLLAVAFGFYFLPAPLGAQDGFDLGRYEELKRTDRPLLEFVLGAMQETVFHALAAVDRPVSAPRPCYCLERS